MRSRIVPDASFAVALLVPEVFSQIALSIWQQGLEDDVEFVAPPLLRYEVCSALFRKTLGKKITPEDALAALVLFNHLDIVYMDPADLPLRAMELARQFHRLNTYDSIYLALAERLNCPFWTADERLYNAITPAFKLIHWLGQQEKPSPL